MEKISLTELAAKEAVTARDASSGRGAHTVFGDHTTTLRQTVIALAAGQLLHEHNSPGDATLQVLSGRVRLAAAEPAGAGTIDGEAGDLLVIPAARHSLEALDDSVILLTVAKPR
ncbi:cupin domain-containing protein [Actinoplanes sp. NPDC049596]|uniref:cupin domain-containing protein n=1 Tax=unclassified Actinoplanes TaxID=2626549 RepID=UPI003415EBF5